MLALQVHGFGDRIGAEGEVGFGRPGEKDATSTMLLRASLLSGSSGAPMTLVRYSV